MPPVVELWYQQELNDGRLGRRANLLQVRTPTVELDGASDPRFQRSHAIDGAGPPLGPSFDGIGSSRTADQPKGNAEAAWGKPRSRRFRS